MLHNPDEVMRRIQYRLMQLLETVPVPDYIYGFERGKSIPTMAQIHVNKKVVISLDIKDFFPSVKEKHVTGLMEQYGCSPDVARIIGELCTYRAFVPQGAITSPKISNLVAAASFAPPIKEYCDASGLTLSIYADDITLSYPEEKAFASREEENNFVKLTIRFVQDILRGYGFRLNREKIKVMRPHTRQWVCGAVVNEKVNLLKTERAKLRAIVYNCSKNGIEAEAAKSNLGVVDFVAKYGGKLNWYIQLNPEKARPLALQFRKLARPLTKLYPELNINKAAWDSGAEDPDEGVDVNYVEEVKEVEIPCLSFITTESIEPPLHMNPDAVVRMAPF